ncbi:hypothetical protein KAR91_59015 [Candidatus Pacearchaeota archaeon]|nr:hypothetical protein [Candidatus Pacearchaeota archaeon]
MQIIKNNPHYIWLSRLKPAPIIIFLLLNLVVYIVLMTLIYKRFIPGVLTPLNEVLTPAMMDWILAGFDKIILWLSVWIFFFFLIGGVLARAVWNVRKLFDVLDNIETR